MLPLEEILIDYREGDLEKRLNLFLSYRSLRDHFSSIEQEEGLKGFINEKVTTTPKRKRKTIFHPFLCCLKWCQQISG